MTEKMESAKNYKGFVAGAFAGIAKLSGECESNYPCPYLEFTPSSPSSCRSRFYDDSITRIFPEIRELDLKAANSISSWPSIQ
jgi:hypothetical protein